MRSVTIFLWIQLWLIDVFFGIVHYVLIRMYLRALILVENRSILTTFKLSLVIKFTVVYFRVWNNLYFKILYIYAPLILSYSTPFIAS